MGVVPLAGATGGCLGFCEGSSPNGCDWSGAYFVVGRVEGYSCDDAYGHDECLEAIVPLNPHGEFVVAWCESTHSENHGSIRVGGIGAWWDDDECHMGLIGCPARPPGPSALGLSDKWGSLLP